MGFLGLSIAKESTLSEIKSQYATIQKKLETWEKLKPYSEDRFRMLAVQDNVLIPLLPFEEDFLYDLALHSDVLRTALNALRNRLFRRGFKIIAKTENADLLQEAELKAKIKRVNKNKQGLIEMFEQFEWDLDVQDNGYLIALKDYYFDFQGKIIDKMTNTKEIIRASPLKVRIISDFQGNLGVNPEGEKVYVSPGNRSKLYKEKEAKTYGFYDPISGKEMRQAFFRGEVKDGEFVYYMEEEVLYTPKHNGSLIYGYSPIFAIWQKIIALIQQDRYIMTAYQKGRPPRGLLTIGTTNYASAQKAWEFLKAETKKDPHSINPFVYEVGQKGGQSAQWIDLLRPLTEMQFIEGRNEMRRSILAIYGLMPMMGGDITTSGGLNVEDKQIEVSDIAVERGQKIFNQKVIPWILKQFGITEWDLILQEPEEQDELEDQTILQAKIDNATKMRQMGFKVEYFPKEKDFEFSEETTEPLTDQPFIEFSDVKKAMEQEDMRKRAFKLLEKEKELLGDNFIKKDIKQELVERLKESLWKKKFEGLSKQTSDQVRNAIVDGVIQSVTLKELTDRIMSLGVSKIQAETIARTEQTSIQNEAREVMFSDLDIKKVKWIGPNDNRTSELCKEIKDKTKQGVTLEELKGIIKETATKFGIVARDYVAHPNERHTIGLI